MSTVNPVKRQAALENSHQGGLHEVRTGGESLKQQDKLVALAASRPNLTATQLCWLAVGGTVDDAGRCQPEDEFFRMQDFFGYKRRASEIAVKAEVVEDHPRARLVYCKAAKNPYTRSGGSGLAVIASRLKVLPTAGGKYAKIEQSNKSALAESEQEVTKQSASDHIAHLQSMLG